jgi:hypothetical protein
MSEGSAERVNWAVKFGWPSNISTDKIRVFLRVSDGAMLFWTLLFLASYELLPRPDGFQKPSLADTQRLY